MKYLIFDTETTGLPTRWGAHYTETEVWPRIVQLSWIVAEDDKLIVESDNIIKCDFDIPKQASDVHGITNEISQEKGLKLDYVLDMFWDSVKEVDTLICHNINFDLPIIQCEMFRCGCFESEIRDLFQDLEMFCTMKASTNILKIPGKRGGYKWPKLEELYDYCFQKKLDGAHNALVDVTATFECYKYLKNGMYI